jgi:8-hydroxy-5-deazaflavin:NADPH oxidoreductase
MTSFTIFGTGNMGSAIAGLVSAGGSSVQHIGRETGATVEGDVVVLAVPYPALDGILAAYADQFAGKVVVDITNPLDFETFDALVTPADGSAAAELAAALPQSRVVKAFNTTFAATLASKTVGATDATTVLVAGDDADAKSLVIDAVVAGGVAAIDAGSLKRARELEAVGFLQLTLAVSERIGWTGGFAVVA